MTQVIHKTARAPVPTPEVLIVDDEPTARKMLAAMLNPVGLSPMAADADETIGILGNEQFEAVISELRMTQTSGIQLLAAVPEPYPSLAFLVPPALTRLESEPKPCRREQTTIL